MAYDNKKQEFFDGIKKILSQRDFDYVKEAINEMVESKTRLLVNNKIRDEGGMFLECELKGEIRALSSLVVSLEAIATSNDKEG